MTDECTRCKNTWFIRTQSDIVKVENGKVVEQDLAYGITTELKCQVCLLRK
jgi:hypothetical protein